MSNQMIPPLLVDKMIISWSFEGGGFVAVVAGGKIPSTAAALDMAQAMIDQKRAELERLAADVPAKAPDHAS